MLSLDLASPLWQRLTLLGALCLTFACDEQTDPDSRSEEEVTVDDVADDDDDDDGDDDVVDGGGKPAPSRDASARDGGNSEHARDGGRPSLIDANMAPTSDGGRSDAGAIGCGAKLLPIPEDPGERGPWHVGVRTVKIGRLTVEVLYPAKPGSTEGMPEATYDPRDWLPPSQKDKVPPERSKQVGPIGGHLYRDVPIDDAHGPYPTVVFIHGTASFRIASGTTNAHWASRGFVVLAADYPGLGLSDKLSETLECVLPTSGAQDIEGDVKAQIEALRSKTGPLGFLGDRADVTRLGISGHSQGGCATATLGALPNVRIVMPLSGSAPVSANPELESILYVSGIQDQVIGYELPLIGNVVCPLFSFSTVAAYEASAGPPKVKKRVAGIEGGGHLVVTDLCQTNAQGRNPIQEAQFSGVCGVNSAVIIGLPALGDCGTVDWQKGLKALNYVTAAALDETLHCADRSQAFAAMKSKVPEITQFKEALK